MKKKILLIGKKSFISNNLYFFLKDKFFIKKISFEMFLKLKKEDLKKYSYIINCSINKNYIKLKYSYRNDFDYQIAKKLNGLNCKLIFFSTRKVYNPGDNLKENSNLNPKCNYSKNKLITEKYLQYLLKDKVLILRLSNLVDFRNVKNYRIRHKIFIDYFFENIKKNNIYKNKSVYKDFLSINQFCKIIYSLISKNIIGVYNVSIGKKVYINKLISWLNFYNKKKITVINPPKNINSDSFYLNNKKLRDKIKLKISLIDLEKDCKTISKNYFLK